MDNIAQTNLRKLVSHSLEDKDNQYTDHTRGIAFQTAAPEHGRSYSECQRL